MVHARDKTKNILFVYFLTELRTNHLSYSIYEHLCLAKANKTIEQTGKHLSGNKLQIKKSFCRIRSIMWPKSNKRWQKANVDFSLCTLFKTYFLLVTIDVLSGSKKQNCNFNHVCVSSNFVRISAIGKKRND